MRLRVSIKALIGSEPITRRRGEKPAVQIRSCHRGPNGGFSGLCRNKAPQHRRFSIHSGVVMTSAWARLTPSRPKTNEKWPIIGIGLRVRARSSGIAYTELLTARPLPTGGALRNAPLWGCCKMRQLVYDAGDHVGGVCGSASCLAGFPKRDRGGIPGGTECMVRRKEPVRCGREFSGLPLRPS